ncbi:MAG TPA: zinc ribbon domain-containing protein [Candidatus Sulfotelmatobacter sp.]|nr:zinc ribbon domain-containing protein [Candidatus Sulfotelmatobacter sp.]
MSEVVQQTEQEFWRPASLVLDDAMVVHEALPTMAEACPGCGTEFLLGSRFCHSCGRRRPEAISDAARADAADMAGLWERAVLRVKSVAAKFHWRRIQFPAWLHYLHFDEIKQRLGLPTASLAAFIMGLGCLGGALLVGLLQVKTLVDWQAIQLYRAEWLLAATASFVAGILLKKPSGN